jgi:hypothetical protein
MLFKIAIPIRCCKVTKYTIETHLYYESESLPTIKQLIEHQKKIHIESCKNPSYKQEKGVDIIHALETVNPKQWRVQSSILCDVIDMGPRVLSIQIIKQYKL